MIPDNSHDQRDDNSESDDKPLRQPSRNAKGKRLSNDSFMSTLGKRVAATQIPPTSARHLHSVRREVYIVSEGEDESEPAPLASKKLSDHAFE